MASAGVAAGFSAQVIGWKDIRESTKGDSVDESDEKPTSSHDHEPQQTLPPKLQGTGVRTAQNFSSAFAAPDLLTDSQTLGIFLRNLNTSYHATGLHFRHQSI